MDGLLADFYCIFAPCTEVFIVSSYGKILPCLHPKGGWIISEK